MWSSSSPLAEAMASAPEYFDAPCRSLISAGESSGKLPEMLDRLATMAQKQQHIRSSIIGATIYPILLLTVATSVLTLMLLFVVPRFADLFATLGVPLPATTKGLLLVSVGLKSYWWLLLGSMVAFGVGGKFYFDFDNSSNRASSLNSAAPYEPQPTPVSSPQLRAVTEAEKSSCRFLETVTTGAGGSGDPSIHTENAMKKALVSAANAGADSYYVVDTETTSTGTSVILEALNCN